MDLLIAFVFFILGQVTPRLYDTRWWKRLQAKRTQNSVLKAIGESKSHFLVGDIEVPAIRLLYAFPTPECALRKEDLISSYIDKPRDIPECFIDVIPRDIPDLKNAAVARNRVFTDDLAYDLLELSSTRFNRNGVRIHRPNLIFGPTTFFPFAALNLRLDEPLIEVDSKRFSIRDFAKLTDSAIDLESLSSLPVPLRFGTNTLVLTSDNCIVLSSRSGRQYIEPGGNGFMNLHVIGEGMLRPVDSHYHGKLQTPDPFRTVVRALDNELGLKPGTEWSESDIQWLGIFLDLQRMQPIGVFCLKVALRYEQIAAQMPIAGDAAEHRCLVPLPFRPDNVKSLLQGTWTHLGVPCRITSNQAQASLLLSLFNMWPAQDIKRSFSMHDT